MNGLDARLSTKLHDVIVSPIHQDRPFDIEAQLKQILSEIGIDPNISDSLSFTGRDPIVPSCLRLASAAATGMALKSLAVSRIWQLRGGRPQHIQIDLRKILHRLSPFYEKKWELLNGFPLSVNADPYNPFALKMYQTQDKRWVMPLDLYPRLKRETLDLLCCRDTVRDAAAAIGQWQAAKLEDAGAQHSIVMPMLRTLDEFMDEPIFDYLAARPLIEIEKIGESEPQPLSLYPTAPLAGVKALGMGHVIAGAGVGRALAGFGADVLNLWKPNEFEHEMLYVSANVGVRSATAAPKTATGEAAIRQLLQQADIFYANRRGGYLHSIGLDAASCAQMKPGIIHVNISLHGEAGPWADRPGFDQSAGCVTGVMNLEGGEGEPKLPPIVVVNDYLVAWLATAGALFALERRAREGGSYRVHVSLTRASLWLLSMGIFDHHFAHETAGHGEAHQYLVPDCFRTETALGLYQGVMEQVKMSDLSEHYDYPLLAKGSSALAWL